MISRGLKRVWHALKQIFTVVFHGRSPQNESTAQKDAQRVPYFGDYELVEEIARGGMGVIIRGRDTDLGRDLAIKVLLDEHKAKPEVIQRFIEEAQALGLRTVLLIHGKGESRGEREKSSILKGCANHWLQELSIVQAFHSAQPQHGGTGAVYVLLQKSEEMKRKNRLRFNKGREPSP